MFKRKNKNKKEKEINIPLNDVYGYKSERMYYRPVSYYRIFRNRFYNISYGLIVLASILLIFGMVTIDKKNKMQSVYTTNVLGQTYKYEETEKRKEIVRNFIKNYNKQNEK